LEESKQQLASFAEARLASLDQAAANAVASLEAAAEKLREEVSNAERALAQSREQLASQAEAKIALLSRLASRAVVDIEAEQRRFRSPYNTSPKEPGDLYTRRSANQPAAFDNHATPSKRRAVAAMLTLGAALFLVVTIAPLGEYLSTPPPVQMHLQAEVPSDFADQSPYWSTKRRAKEEETAEAYWRAAVFSLPSRYPFGSQLPADPPPEFQVGDQYAPTQGAGTVAEIRAHYWEKLQAYWAQRRFWIETQPENDTWATRLRHVWGRIKAKFV